MNPSNIYSPMLNSENPLPFPVDEGVRVMTPNQIYEAYQQKGKSRKAMLKNKYVVIGAGKTGADAIVYLQREMNIDPANIAWVIAADVWMFDAGGNGGNPFDWPKYMAKYENDMDKAAFTMEEKGMIVRLDKTVTPTRFRFPMVQRDEFKLLKKVKTTIRRGRATAIRRKYNSGVSVEFGSDHSPWEAFAPIEDCVFVHAASPGPFNGLPMVDIFASPKKLTLNILFAPPVSQSMSCLAKIEAGRVKRTLNTEAMKRLAQGYGEKLEGNETDEDLLKILIQGVDLDSLHQATITQAVLLTILDARAPSMVRTSRASTRT